MKSVINPLVVSYRKNVSIAVKTNCEIEAQLVALFGVFVEKPTKADKPCWVFSAKRKEGVQKIAKALKLKTAVYDAQKGSIALFTDLSHEQAFLSAGGHFCSNLIDGQTHFSGWIFAQNKEAEVVELCKSLAS